MITKDQVIPMILKACPSFQETWDKSDDHDLLYAVMGDIARHLLTMYKTGRTDEFGSLCQVIEALHR